ncbi:MAG: hypothetical protein FH749_04915 [Firmicutes bacterium]|nr:hypothetical protein [Bacillota bacterium]
MEVTLTLSHWIYLLVVLTVVLAMVLKRDVVLPCIVGIFVIGLVYNEGSIIPAVQAMFRALLVAGSDLFDIMLVIALMVAMLKSMAKLGADTLMVAPARRLMVNPHVAFFALGGVMYICALFFWPTPATALVGVMLLPVAIKAGLPAMAAAMSVNILGHGMALSGDLIIQGAPGLSERTIGLEPGAMLNEVAILSLVVGLVASVIAYLMMRKEIKTQQGLNVESGLVAATADDAPIEKTNKNIAFAIIVPVTFMLIIGTMIYASFEATALAPIMGGDATALLGGAAAALLIIMSFANDGDKALESVVVHLREGMLFAIKIFAPVIPIAGFFFLGGGDAVAILGEGAPQLLFDLGSAVANSLPVNRLAMSFGNLFVGIITGLDGSGFSGLPLTASLAQSLAPAANASVEAVAAIGQMGAVWAGGGTLTAWAFGLVATAGIAGVSPMDLARKNFIPVICGLAVAAVVAVFLM